MSYPKFTTKSWFGEPDFSDRLLGFAITNLFIGSFGVVNLDVLRVRYIVTGLLFGVFISTIIFPLYGLLHLLREKRNDLIIVRILSILLFTFYRYAVIYLVIAALSVFSATSATPHIPLPDQSEQLSWLDWFARFPDRILVPTLTVYAIFLVAAIAIVLVVALILLLILFAIKPKEKDGIRQSRKEVVIQSYREVIGKIRFVSILKFLFLAFLFMIALTTIGDLIRFAGGSSFKLSPPSLSTDWARFIGVAFLIYVFIATYFIFLFFAPSTSDEDFSATSDDPLDKYYAWIYFFAWGIILIVPVYALNIYPYLPQQVGGGELIKANVVISDDLSGLFLNGNTDMYILDHTSKGTIFLLHNNADDSQKIVEVAESQIKSVIYELPTPTPGATPSPQSPLLAATPTLASSPSPTLPPNVGATP